MLIAAVLVFALSRAELLERFNAPVVTQSDGLVKVYAMCPEDMRKEFQSPVARFAADTVSVLYGGLMKKSVRCETPGIVIHLGEVRTNNPEVVSRAYTNDDVVATHITILSPGFADLYRLKLEIVKGFYRRIVGKELTDDEAVDAYRHADPKLRVVDERMRLERWLMGELVLDDEEGIALMRKVFEPGVASKRDVLIFASRLYFYPPQCDLRLLGKYESLSFAEAVKLGAKDPLIRMLAYLKANDMLLFGNGRSAEMSAAAVAYRKFLLALAAGRCDVGELEKLLEDADVKLNIAMEKAEMVGGR